MAQERVQKVLAAAGYGSRRACEKLIEAGRVKVNGKVIHLGDQADPAKDSISVDGKLIRKTIEKIYIALNKPKGYLSDIDLNHPRPTVNDLIGISEPLFAVGRLDLDSEGLILMTNDGKMANRLTHPRYEHEKEYEVFVITQPDQEQLDIWRRGVVMEDGYRTLPAKVEVINNANNGTWLRITLKEGKKRQIRKVGSRIGMPVGKIKRVRIGPLKLGKLRSGEWRYLTEREVQKLMEYTTVKKPSTKK
ncbi:MAG: pseudouridine synthase [Anaerolineaceae bacterium]|jgi:23S rRNA pseudouridine2605 synthase|nr:pseudouridine synthase [Anaerolineaceae bacterium]